MSRRRRRWRAFGGALGLAALLLFAARDPLADELARAVELALARNAGIEAAAARVDAALAGERAAFALYLPAVDLSLRGGHGWEPAALVPDWRLDSYWEGEARLELRQRLWDAGRRDALMDRAQADTAAAEARRAAAEEDLALRVALAYLDGVDAAGRQALLIAAIADLRGLGGTIEQQIAGGVSTVADRYQLATRLDFLAAELARAAGDRASAEARLQSLTGETAFAFLQPPFPAQRLPADGREALQRALAMQPTLDEARALIAAGDAARAAAEADFWPILDLVVVGRLAAHPAGLDDSREELLALLQLRWRLFDGLGRQAMENRRTHEAAAAGFQFAERQRRLEVEIAQAFARLAMLDRRQPALAAADQSALRTFRLYREQFGIGERALIDLVDARRELLTRSVETLGGEVERLRAAYDLAFAMGELRLWLSGAPPLQSRAMPAPLQLAWAGPIVALPAEGVVVSAAVAVAVAARTVPATLPGLPPAPIVGPVVAGKIGDGPGLSELAQRILDGGNQ